MATEYRLDIKTRAGLLVAQVTDFLWLSYRKQVNAPGLLQFGVNGEHAIVDLLELDSQVEVWRLHAQALDWTCDFYGLYRTPVDRSIRRNRELFTGYCPGQMHWLNRRHILYPAGTASRTEFTNLPAETIMKELVTWNTTSAATVANGRDRAGAITGITVEPDQGRGNIVSWSCTRKNLLDELQALAQVAGGDFDLVKTGSQAWEFRFYPGQLGADRRTDQQFAFERHNVSEIIYSYPRTTEKTVAIVGGQGEGAGRSVVVRTGPGYTPANDIEMFVDGRSSDTTASLEARGDEALETHRAVEELSCTILQSASSLYGKHYFLGDLVRASYRDLAIDAKVLAVDVGLNSTGEEKIDVDIGTP